LSFAWLMWILCPQKQHATFSGREQHYSQGLGFVSLSQPCEISFRDNVRLQ